jgi:hypothetical protein
MMEAGALVGAVLLAIVMMYGYFILWVLVIVGILALLLGVASAVFGKTEDGLDKDEDEE